MPRSYSIQFKKHYDSQYVVSREVYFNLPVMEIGRRSLSPAFGVRHLFQVEGFCVMWNNFPGKVQLS